MDRQQEFTAWYQETYPRLLTTLLAFCGDLDSAVDAAAEAGARAWQHWSRVRDLESPQGWLYVTAVHYARRQARLSRRELDAHRRAASAPVHQPADAVDLWSVIAGLPPRQQQAVVLRHVAHLTEAEIAAAMGIRRGTVSATLHTAYARLRAELTQPEADSCSN